MIVKVINESGHFEALLGLSLSFNVDEKYLNGSKDMFKIGLNLAKRENGYSGEGKFLESIVVWMDVTAARYWWQQFDTYRIGVTKQSQSTMHTLTKRPLTEDDFEGGVPPAILRILNDAISRKDFDTAKKLLPESFLQRRVLCTNYKALRHICLQRDGHRLPEWRQFIDACRGQLMNREYIFDA